jgi:hypothetical protein
MRFPIRKPSERLQKKPESQGPAPDENPLEALKKWFYHFINTRPGWPMAAVLVAVIALWAGWDKVKELPGVAPLLSKAAELRGLPRAQGDRFAIVIAKLGNDKDGVHRRLVDDALRGHLDREVEVILPDRTISIEGAEKPQTRSRPGMNAPESCCARPTPT